MAVGDIVYISFKITNLNKYPLTVNFQKIVGGLYTLKLFSPDSFNISAFTTVTKTVSVNATSAYPLTTLPLTIYGVDNNGHKFEEKQLNTVNVMA